MKTLIINHESFAILETNVVTVWFGCSAPPRTCSNALKKVLNPLPNLPTLISCSYIMLHKNPGICTPRILGTCPKIPQTLSASNETHTHAKVKDISLCFCHTCEGFSVPHHRGKVAHASAAHLSPPNQPQATKRNSYEYIIY